MNASKPMVSTLHCAPDAARSAALPGCSQGQLSAEDMIDYYKVLPCPRTCNHDWATCMYAHPSEKARRRSLAQHWYSAIFCVDMLHKNQCKKGDDCNLAHSVFEYWMHPDKFRTKFCKEGADCKRTVCFFAHNPQELRQPGDYVPRAIGSMNRSNSPNAVGLPFASSTSGSSPGRGGVSNPSMLLPPAKLSPAACSPPAPSVLVGAACFNQSFGSSSTAPLNNSGNMNPSATDLQTQHQLALLQQQLPDAGSIAHSAAVQLHSLKDVASSQAAAELARLKVEYADRVREAESAAAKAAEASSQLQQLAAALDAPNQDAAAAAARDSPSASRRLQLEAAQRLPGGLPGLDYSPSISAASAATVGYGVGALLGGTGLDAVADRNMSLDSQLRGLSMNSSRQAASALAAGMLPQASAAAAPQGLSAAGFGGQLHHSAGVLHSAASWPSVGEDLTLAGILGLTGSTTESPAGSSGSQLLPGDQVLSAFLMSPQQQLHQASMEMPTGGSAGQLLLGDQTLSACLLSAQQQAQQADALLSTGSSAGHLLPGDQVLSAMLLPPQQQQVYTGLSGGSIGGPLLSGNGALSAYLLSQQHQQF